MLQQMNQSGGSHRTPRLSCGNGGGFHSCVTSKKTNKFSVTYSHPDSHFFITIGKYPV